MVIIARYREDVSWADELGFDHVVYDKSGDPVQNARPLPNIGREAHTYFSHIVAEYDRLAPMNVFLQGDPFDHLDDHGRAIVETLRNRLADIADHRVPFKGLAWFKLKSDALGRPHDLDKPENKGRWAGWGRDIPVGELFERLFGVPMPTQIICRAPTGNFCVTAERIRTRPAHSTNTASAWWRPIPKTSATPGTPSNGSGNTSSTAIPAGTANGTNSSGRTSCCP